MQPSWLLASLSIPVSAWFYSTIALASQTALLGASMLRLAAARLRAAVV